MAVSWRWWVVVPVILGGMLLAACGGDGDDEEASDTGPSEDGVVATEQADEGMMDEEPSDDDMMDEESMDDGDGGDMGAGGDAFEDVPVPSGADEVSSGEWSGSIPGAVPGIGADPETFTSVEFKEYEVDASPSDVINFYRDNLSGWNEEMALSTGSGDEEGGFGVWTRDDGQKALWITAGTSDGATDLIVLVGATE